MPKGPQGQKRPADVIGNAVHVMRIATGEIEEGQPVLDNAALAGRKGGKIRALLQFEFVGVDGITGAEKLRY